MRLIDADALSEKLCKITTFIKDGDKFQRMINDAPTIELDGDTISRQEAIDGIDEYINEYKYNSIKRSTMQEARVVIEQIPSAPDSRQRGEWVGCTGCEHYDQQQTRLICHECKRYYSDKYKGGEDE